MKEPFFTIDERIETLCRQAEEQCAGIFRQIDDTADYNAQKVLAAFIKNRVSEPMFAGTTGYGYGDIGREALDSVLADIFGCEDALIRHPCPHHSAVRRAAARGYHCVPHRTPL